MLFRGISAIFMLFFSFSTPALVRRSLLQPSTPEACYVDINEAPRTALSDCLNKNVALAKQQLQIKKSKQSINKLTQVEWRKRLIH